MEKAQVCRDKNSPNDWRVEKIDDDGGIEVAIFSGPRSHERAVAHEAAEYGRKHRRPANDT